MKQKIKKLGILFLLMILFNTSQEKEISVCAEKCPVSLAATRVESAKEEAAIDDELVPLSPISRFILIKY